MEISPYGKFCLFVLCSTSIFTQKTYTLALTDASTSLTLMAPNRVSTRPTNANKHPGAIEATEKRKRRTKEEIERDKALEWARKVELQRQKEQKLKDIADLEAMMAAKDDEVSRARRGDRKHHSEALAGTQHKETVDMDKDDDLPGSVDFHDGLTEIVDDPEPPAKRLKQPKAPVDQTTGSTHKEPAPKDMRMKDKVRCFDHDIIIESHVLIRISLFSRSCTY